ncbi:BTB/POZ domain-containing protein KCTD18 [Hemicordylus capensis]|uniref:BTB/POZ domain-containing protein KCTD18 n=1 Tax=Hemicordylus capensis TaxID=884348 RepID=UPI002303675C|nr:BTB/POZ domain-containing protein KCTD18 [Hemicordylus capensis]XP_053135017.1 BTB/POZ domain-containing protein KCTD18 [Hemicordylus capensis]XP_053135019.1 BTB/POZ domain-containing protein KCTD18 [Hemicordylus capensis]XP_053135025.1 BTB/POZ domain-containing protein KCTD18 [Hemicordylus capensis]XP_053135035.1 BTB/POZ domain-containing protein KCTD18 [Hemicordylus capensis]XP_053135044.1 BTB/POZ domain-containing protein KCTD18 [Hemicordylus capensis]
MEDGSSGEVVDILQLNVGGCIYTARRESLCRFKDSMLASMFSGRFPLKMDDSGACLIDRNGKLFKYLLDYLHGEVRLPEDEQTRVALQEEADYFGIPYPYNLADHLANEMEMYSLKSNIELKKALVGFCDSYGLICTKPTVWVLHYLNTSGASCESRIIGVYATKADGTAAIEKELGGRIHSKSIYKREAGNNVQYIWSYYSVTELKEMMDAFEAWEGRGVSYWRVPQELIECWTLEERPLKGSLQNMTPVRKRRLTDLAEDEESGLSSRTGRKPIQFSGPSTSTHIKVKNSASLKVATRHTSSHSQVTLKRPSRVSLLPYKIVTKTLPAESIPLMKNSRASVKHSENGAICQLTLKTPLSKKSTTSRVVKLKRTPLRHELSPQHASSVLSKTVEQQAPSVAVTSTSASPNQEEFGLSVGSVDVKNHLQNVQLNDDA